MHRSHTYFVPLALVLSAAALSACGGVESATAETAPPVIVEEIAGNDEVWRLTLSESAAERLDIQLSTVEASGGGYVVPSAAIIIDPTGTYWVYTSPEPLVYVREEIRPVHEENQQAFFDEGPAVGTPVVTTGLPELYGAEFGIGK